MTNFESYKNFKKVEKRSTNEVTDECKFSCQKKESWELSQLN